VFEVSSKTNRDRALLLAQLEALLGDERDCIANLANTAAFLFYTVPEINWVGFYLSRGEELVLGPFQGKPACIRIPMGRGVCGTAASEKRIVLVDNVHEFPGHIACDSDSNSEIVVPLVVEGKVVGVLDIDSPQLGRFKEDDITFLEDVSKIVVQYTDWS
jgi:L-methionine (R)-S-oxide reductase